ncbi:MAG: GNAT family N-acetyltransferase [Chloroflexi bacterium]|nr:MAG: GNAT family N-acetyltransferase [Chloroflexota bacterium]
MSDSEIVIREPRTYAEFDAIRQVQRAAFEMDPEGGLYVPFLVTAARNGGIVLGAFDGERLVGYIFSYLGRAPDGQIKLVSQTMGVLSEYRGRGIATRLKLAQRERALAQGLSLITWTFDPLLSPNAHLNLHKLGGIVRIYERNYYGEDFPGIYRGLPTDRFLVEWWIRSEHVVEQLRALEGGGRAEEDRAPPFGPERPLVTHVEGEGTAQRLAGYELGVDAPEVWVEIPTDFLALKATDRALARAWREGSRALFEHYFARGYVAVDFQRWWEGERRRGAYRLWRPPTADPTAWHPSDLAA